MTSNKDIPSKGIPKVKIKKGDVDPILKSPIYRSNDTLKVTNWVPKIDDEVMSVLSNSWFDIQKVLNLTENCEPTEYKMTIPVISPESIKQQLKRAKLKKFDKEPEFMVVKKIRLQPTHQQKLIINSWFDAFDRMYNVTVKYVRSKIYIGGKLDLTNKNDITNFIKVRTALSDKRNTIIKSMSDNRQKSIPVHLLDEAIKLAIANYKGCFTKLILGQIKKFRVRPLIQNRRRRILIIESAFFTRGTFCYRTFKTMKSSEPLINIDKTCT
jgi:hypothetical protein